MKRNLLNIYCYLDSFSTNIFAVYVFSIIIKCKSKKCHTVGTCMLYHGISSAHLMPHCQNLHVVPWYKLRPFNATLSELACCTMDVYAPPICIWIQQSFNMSMVQYQFQITDHGFLQTHVLS